MKDDRITRALAIANEMDANWDMEVIDILNEPEPLPTASDAYDALKFATERELRKWARDTAADFGDEDMDASDYVHECVDGSEFVTNYWRQESLALLAGEGDYDALDEHAPNCPETARTTLAYAVAERFLLAAMHGEDAA